MTKYVVCAKCANYIEKILKPDKKKGCKDVDFTWHHCSFKVDYVTGERYEHLQPCYKKNYDGKCVDYLKDEGLLKAFHREGFNSD